MNSPRFKSTCLLVTFFCFSALAGMADHPGSFLFRENKGQITNLDRHARADVLFSGRNGQSAFYLTKTSLSYQFFRVDKWTLRKDLKLSRTVTEPAATTIYRLDLQWLGTTGAREVLPLDASHDVENFYSSACYQGALNVRSYSGLLYRDLYQHIDLHLYSEDGTLKYDYLLAPYADHQQIQLRVEGASHLHIGPQGELMIETPLGTISEPAPLVTQEGRLLKASWKIQGEVISFEIAGRDVSKSMIIDPLVRVWGTYYGNATGTDASQILGTCSDVSGNVYVSGETFTSSQLIATTGSHQQTFAGGGDAFLAKFNGSGQRIWATYYGGIGSERGYGCACDASGNVYMTGSSTSTGPAPGNGIATVGSHQPAMNTLWGSGFLVKFNSSGVRQWGTFYGGNVNENAFACATDATGNVYITGQSESTSGIATPGSYQPAFGGNSDCFLAKFNSAGVRQWGTYIGGAATMGFESGFACGTDAGGNVYLVGAISGGSPLGTPGSFQPIYLGGETDGFVAKFDGNGLPLWSTFYGSTMFAGNDEVTGCAIDGSGNIYFTGHVTAPAAFTISPPPAGSASSIIATPGSYMPQPAAGSGYNSYVAKLSPSGQRLWGSFFGYNSQAHCCCVDVAGNVYCGGSTYGTYTNTAGAHQPNPSPNGDAFFAQFDMSGSLLNSSYYGGAREESAFACTTDPMGSFYLSGFSNSFGGTAIATPGSYQPSYPGTNSDGAPNSFLVKFSSCSPLLVSSSITPVSCAGSSNGSATITASASGDPITYSWSPVAGTASVITSLAAGNYTCMLTSSCGVNIPQVVSITSPPALSVNAQSSQSVACVGSMVTLTATAAGGTGSINISWSGGPAVSGPATASAIVTSAAAFSVTATDANGCVASRTVNLASAPCAGITGDDEQSGLIIFPNPNAGLFYVRMAQPARLRIYSASGQLIRDQNGEAGQILFDMSNEARGIYLLLVGEGDQVIRLVHE